jgi:hypothetical protein
MTSYDNGLIVYNGVSFTGYTSVNSALPEDYLLDVAKDTLGNLWIGSYSKGLIKIVESTLAVKEKQFTQKWALVSNLILRGDNIKINGPLFKTAEIIDIQGKSLTFNITSTNEINTSKLETGHYFLRLSSTYSAQTIPFIIN